MANWGGLEGIFLFAVLGRPTPPHLLGGGGGQPPPPEILFDIWYCFDLLHQPFFFAKIFCFWRRLIIFSPISWIFFTGVQQKREQLKSQEGMYYLAGGFPTMVEWSSYSSFPKFSGKERKHSKCINIRQFFWRGNVTIMEQIQTCCEPHYSTNRACNNNKGNKVCCLVRHRRGKKSSINCSSGE